MMTEWWWMDHTWITKDDTTNALTTRAVIRFCLSHWSDKGCKIRVVNTGESRELLSGMQETSFFYVISIIVITPRWSLCWPSACTSTFLVLHFSALPLLTLPRDLYTPARSWHSREIFTLPRDPDTPARSLYPREIFTLPRDPDTPARSLHSREIFTRSLHSREIFTLPRNPSTPARSFLWFPLYI